MKPVAIVRFSKSEGPGYLAEFLDGAAIPWQLVRLDAGDALPSIRAVSGMAMMGGPMSVNDRLPWIPPLLELIRQSIHHDIPLLGHCLGGQLMSKALGGEVTDNPCMEMGWHEVEVVDAPQARNWFGAVRSFTTFQWHYQTFSIPPGATRVLSNGFCQNQAFVLGRHIGFQCHIEMTASMVAEWCADAAADMPDASMSASVQPVAAILQDVDRRVGALNTIAETIYSRWLEGVAH